VLLALVTNLNVTPGYLLANKDFNLSIVFDELLITKSVSLICTVYV